MFTDPLKNLKNFDIRENMIVVDLGAGMGFYSVLASGMVPSGKVYAIEINRDYLKNLINKIKEKGIDNIKCIWGDVEKVGGTKLKDNIADRVIVSNVFFQLEDKEDFFKELDRILKPGGKILFIDHEEESLLFKGKHKEIVVPKEKAKKSFEEKGFIFERDFFAGDHNYGIIFNKLIDPSSHKAMEGQE